MRRLLCWATRLYPPGWRERYGAEFEALLEDTPLQRADVWDVLRGALIMRMTKVNFVAIAAAFAVAGALIAGIATLVRFTGYTSTGTIAVQAADASKDTAQFDLQRAMQRALSRGSLAEMIQRPALNLYQSERTRLPLEDVIEKMRHDTMIRFVGFEGGRLTASVSFRYADAQVAQRTTEALMERLRAELVKQAPIQVIGQASPGEPTLSGERWKVIARGALAGLVAGLLFGGVWNLVRNRGRWSLRRIAGFALAGTVIGFGIGIRIPDKFVSTAVLHTSGAADVRTILSDENLAEIARAEGLAIAEMKAGIRVIKMGRSGAYEISFHDRDPVKAQHVTRALIGAWLKAGLAGQAATVTEVLDPPSVPASAYSPNRLVITMMGTFAGLLLGFAASRFRRPVVV